ncbi:hypothetical protein [Prevotella vespertina]|nr:hypothetical protein [Prevotella vespertina]
MIDSRLQMDRNSEQIVSYSKTNLHVIIYMNGTKQVVTGKFLQFN